METGQGYAQKDPHMRKCEAEAYLHGNGLMWRDFEDNYKQKNLNLENINSKINYLLEHYEKETLVMQDKKVEESVFAPNHYCVHHGGSSRYPLRYETFRRNNSRKHCSGRYSSN